MKYTGAQRSLRIDMHKARPVSSTAGGEERSTEQSARRKRSGIGHWGAAETAGNRHQPAEEGTVLNCGTRSQIVSKRLLSAICRAAQRRPPQLERGTAAAVPNMASLRPVDIESCCANLPACEARPTWHRQTESAAGVRKIRHSTASSAAIGSLPASPLPWPPPTMPAGMPPGTQKSGHQLTQKQLRVVC